MSTITISAPPNSRVDRDGVRTYHWAGSEYLSVTSAFKRAGIAYPLHQWTLSQVIDRAVGEVETLNAMLTRPRKPREHHASLDKKRAGEASTWLRSAATEERDRRAAIGSTVHDAIAEAWVPGDIPDVIETEKDGKAVVVDGFEVRSRLLHFLDWMRVSRARILAQEFQVFNLTVGYGGSGDLIVEFPSGRRVLIDTKTGNHVLAEHYLQVVGYRGAEFSGRDDVTDPFVTGLLNDPAHPLELGVLHLGTDHWEYLAFRDDPDAWDAFVGCLAYARWLGANPAVDGLVAARRDNRPGEAEAVAA